MPVAIVNSAWRAISSPWSGGDGLEELGWEHGDPRAHDSVDLVGLLASGR